MNQVDRLIEQSDEQLEKKERKWICGFWQRIVAYIIDMLLLGLIGFSAGFFLETTFVEIGDKGRFIGFCVALVYFGVMNSKIFMGQTLGKRVLKLRVVDGQNKPISLIRSLGRYCILGLPYFLNGSYETMSPFLIYPVYFVIYGGAFAIIYLYVFNRVTRQSLHDLIFSTYVVNVGVEETNIAKVWRPHLAVVGLFFVAVVIVPIVTSNSGKQEPFADLRKSEESLMKNPLIDYVSVSEGKTSRIWRGNENTETTFISAKVFLMVDQTSSKTLANELAQTLANLYPQALQKDTIQIVLIYGYDIGIFSKGHKFTHLFKPTEFGEIRQLGEIRQ